VLTIGPFGVAAGGGVAVTRLGQPGVRGAR
jgi:hypothetical protein